ncbi:MAG: S8 family serine peptidase, partial [Planctomycetaceae bacterium]
PDFQIDASLTPNDPLYGSLYGLHNTGQSGGTAGADIDAAAAWDVSTGSRDVVVAVIDEGIDFSHGDLAANMWTNPAEIPGNGVDDDANGFIDDVHGFDFHNNRGNVFSAADGDLHGTHVAGTIGAVGNNATGVVGVNWQTSLMSLKFLGPDGGSTSHAIRAGNYATMMRTTYGVNVRVTNNSWGGGGYVQGLLDAINAGGAANILFVAAAGNDGRNTDTTPSYPASYTSPFIVSVAATDRRDALASFSNYGLTSVDLGAPGVNIVSTVPSNGYASLSGTSMASPQVAGAAALALSVAPTLSVTDLKNLLLTTADPIPALAGKTVTGGRLNANALVRALGLTVVSTTPAVGSVVNAPPTTVTITFRNAFDPATLAAGDLAVNGVAATTATVVDPVTARFEFAASPVTMGGQQVMALAAGALTRASDGAPLRAFTGSFRYDASPLSVVGTVPAAASIVPLPLTAIDVEFDEDVAAASVAVSDLVVSQGSVASASLVGPRVVRYALTGVTREAVLSYSLAAGAVTDTLGNPSQPFSATLSLDAGTVAIAAPLAPVAPLGGLIYTGSRAGLLSGAADQDAFTIAINAGQSLAVAVTPAAGVAATVTLRDPSGNETVSTPTAAGVAAIVGPVSAAASGTWTITVGNGGAASGTYTVEMLVDAAFEEDSLGRAANDTPAAAQPLGGSLITVASASRAAVTGRIGGPGDVDAYSLPIEAGRRVSIVAASVAEVPLVVSLVGPGGTIVATGTPAATLESVIEGVVVPSAGTYRIEVTGGSATDYGLVAVLGGRFGIEPDDSTAAADVIDAGDVVLAHVGVPWETEAGAFEIPGTPLGLGFDSVGDFGGPTIGQVWNGIEFHWFSTFTLAIAGTNYNNTWFFDFSPTPFAVSLSRHRDGMADVVRIAGEPQPGVVFERLVRRRDGDDHVTITTTVKNLTGSALSGVALLESQNPDPMSEWYTVNDVTRGGRLVVASVSNASLGLGSADPRAVVSSEGQVFGGYVVGDPFDVLLSPADPDGGVDDIALNLAFDIGTLAAGAETSCTFVMVFGDSQADVEAAFDALDIRATTADAIDVYRVALTANRLATISALTPAAGGASADGPDLRLELLAPSGAVLATATGTAGGADATITHAVDATGEYFVRVSVESDAVARAGSYALSVTTAAINVAPTALVLTPDAATLSERKASATRLRLAEIAVTDD